MSSEGKKIDDAASSAQRLARLEERLAWFERHAVEQDKAMLEMSELIERLRAEMRVLRERSGGGAGPASETGATDERPPHY